MNKKDVATIRKQFKLDNEQLHIREIFNVYVQGESGDIYHHVSQPFQLLDRETQELFLVNFKKVLTGQLDTKLFELKFKHDVEDSTQKVLFEGLHASETEEWKTYMLQMVEKMYANKTYDFDTVVTFISAEYRKPMKKRDIAFGEEESNDSYANRFILCSLNKTTLPKAAFVFDYIEKEFKSSSDVDPIIHLSSPLSGFLFPAFQDNAADVNHILYHAGKANEPDISFIENVLQCKEMITAAEDKDCFELIVNHVAGDQVDANIISNMYEEIDKLVQENEENDEEMESPILDYQDVEQILTMSGVEDIDPFKVKNAFQTIVADEKHVFKANNLVPKAIKINTEVAKVSLSPKALKHVKYITHNGKKCLLIEINDEIAIEGFQLDTEIN